jgi:Protein of unknown function (DUF3800)
MKTARHHTINLVTELKSGRHYGVFIDDTGSPGLNTPGLNAKRKSWVAVIVPPAQVTEVMDQLPNALSFLKEEVGIKNPEFHFADIWAGRNAFAKMDLQARLAIFRFMAFIFSTYRFPVLVQTFDPDNAADFQRDSDWPETVGPLRINDHADFALIVLLIRIRLYLKSPEQNNATACVIVDEGRLKKGSSIVLSGLEPTFCAGAVLFASSRTVHPIQLADFAAFAMNRWQLLRVKEKLNEIDKTLLEILSPVAECFSNIDKVRVRGFPNVTNLREGIH